MKHVPWVLLCSQHRISLPCASCSISKDSGIVAVEDTIAEEFGSLIEDLNLASIFVESVVEGVLLLFRSIFA